MGYLNGIETRVVPTNEGYNVIYESGEFSGIVKYVNYKMSNLLMRNKPVYLMVHSDMGDIIELIHQRCSLNSDNFNDLNMEIRTHSKETLYKFIHKDQPNVGNSL